MNTHKNNKQILNRCQFSRQRTNDQLHPCRLLIAIALWDDENAKKEFFRYVFENKGNIKTIKSHLWEYILKLRNEDLRTQNGYEKHHDRVTDAIMHNLDTKNILSFLHGCSCVCDPHECPLNDPEAVPLRELLAAKKGAVKKPYLERMIFSDHTCSESIVRYWLAVARTKVVFRKPSKAEREREEKGGVIVMYLTSAQHHKDFDYFLASTEPGRSTTIDPPGIEEQEPNLRFELNGYSGMRACYEQISSDIASRLLKRFLDSSIKSVNWRLTRRYIDEESFIEKTEEVLLAQIEGVKWPDIMERLGIPRDEDPVQVKLKKIFQFYFKPPKNGTEAEAPRSPSEVEKIIDELRAEHHPAIQQLEILMCYYEDLMKYAAF